MNKNKSLQIVLMVIFVMVVFAIFQKKMGKGLVYGYGYNSSIISVNPVVSSNASPMLSGSFTGGPYSRIYVSVNSLDDKVSYWGSEAIMNSNGTWTLPAGTITTTIPIGVYNVIAMAFVGSGPDVTYDATTKELKITADFSKIDVSSEVDDQKARIKFGNIGNIVKFKISKHSDFAGDNWEDISDHVSIDLDKTAGERKYYIKFLDASNTESETFKETFSFTPNRYIKNSRNSIKSGDTIIQSGKKFSKNSPVWLYFSGIDGKFDSPALKRLKVQTSSSGGFSVNYIAKKAPGKYKWYAVDEKTGKDTKTISYTIRK